MPTVVSIYVTYRTIEKHNKEFPDHGINCACMDKVIRDICELLGIYTLIKDRRAAQKKDFNSYTQSLEGKSYLRIRYILRSVVSKL